MSGKLQKPPMPNVETCLPDWTVCPSCQGGGTDSSYEECAKCRGLGWVETVQPLEWIEYKRAIDAWREEGGRNSPRYEWLFEQATPEEIVEDCDTDPTTGGVSNGKATAIAVLLERGATYREIASSLHVAQDRIATVAAFIRSPPPHVRRAVRDLLSGRHWVVPWEGRPGYGISTNPPSLEALSEETFPNEVDMAYFLCQREERGRCLTPKKQKERLPP